MEIVTYDLKIDHDNSDRFYRDISLFTDEVISAVFSYSQEIIDDYMHYINKTEYEKLRGKKEYLLEFLILGILWNNYADNSGVLKDAHEHMLTGLVNLRKKGGTIKVFSDYLRGIFSTIFLMKKSREKMKYSIKNLCRLLDWLSASGEFDQEVERLIGWQSYLNTKSEVYILKVIKEAAQIAAWFQRRSLVVIGKYTEHIENFLLYENKEYAFREDYIFCGRKRNEYHLNMVGSEILNREYREQFIKAGRKLLLIPACMRVKQDSSCRAVKTDEGYCCMKCSGTCRVSELTSMGEKYNFKVLIIPHESDAFRNRRGDEEETGIIGVACVLNLISGGWKARKLGFAPQCVLLDYCGCKKHWHKNGFPTEINISRLFKILNINEED